MSTWRYCDKCDSPLDFPETPEADTTCSNCGVLMHSMVSTNEWIEKLIERIKVLEDKVNNAKSQTNRTGSREGLVHTGQTLPVLSSDCTEAHQ